MEDDFDSELYFIIAKLLNERFPDIGDVFTRECEKKHLFPSQVFTKNPSFKTLNDKILDKIPNDYLAQLIRLSCPKDQKSPSLFFQQKQQIQPPKPADIITHDLNYCDPLPIIQPFQRISGHFDKCFCVAIDGTSQILITGADDNMIKIWKIPELILIKSHTRIHTKEITEIASNNKYE